MKRALIIAAATLALAVSPALAGGSGSSSTAPSSSGPSYDPVEEYQKGVDHLKAGEYSKAERAFKRVAKVAKKDANTQYMLGLSHFGQEELKPAARAFNKAIKYDAKLYQAYGKLGNVHLQAGDADKADNVLSKLQTASTECAEICPEATDIASAISEIEAAQTSSETLETSSLNSIVQSASLQTGDVMYTEAIRLINVGEYDLAIAELRSAGEILGPHPDVLTYLGFAHRQKGETSEALSFYQTALTIAPDHLSANEYLGEFYVELGDLDRAKAQLEKLNDLCPFGCAQTEELTKWIAGAEA
ncbi:MAG: tetratricopeptide repeat protein [Pseudomonadota bacterium]